MDHLKHTFRLVSPGCEARNALCASAKLVGMSLTRSILAWPPELAKNGPVNDLATPIDLVDNLWDLCFCQGGGPGILDFISLILEDGDILFGEIGDWIAATCAL